MAGDSCCPRPRQPRDRTKKTSSTKLGTTGPRRRGAGGHPASITTFISGLPWAGLERNPPGFHEMFRKKIGPGALRPSGVEVFIIRSTHTMGSQPSSGVSGGTKRLIGDPGPCCRADPNLPGPAPTGAWPFHGAPSATAQGYWAAFLRKGTERLGPSPHGLFVIRMPSNRYVGHHLRDGYIAIIASRASFRPPAGWYPDHVHSPGTIRLSRFGPSSKKGAGTSMQRYVPPAFHGSPTGCLARPAHGGLGEENVATKRKPEAGT